MLALQAGEKKGIVNAKEEGYGKRDRIGFDANTVCVTILMLSLEMGKALVVHEPLAHGSHSFIVDIATAKAVQSCGIK